MGYGRDIVERTFEFSVRIVKLARKLDEKSWSVKTLSNQVLRSGMSIGANVEEAQAGQTKADFIHKYSIALKEGRETKYWLRLLAASEIMKKDVFESIIAESDEIARVIAKIIINARKDFGKN